MKRVLLVIALLLVTAGAFIGLRYYRWIYHSNTKEGTTNIVLLHDGSKYSDVVSALDDQGILRNRKSFDWVAERMSFGDANVKGGRYIIKPGMSNRDVIQKLRLGEQDPINLIINSANTLESLAGEIGKQMAVDSFSYLQYMRDTYLPGSRYSSETILALFIPNTYEVWWNLSAEEITKRIETEHDRFWNAERLASAKRLSMTPVEVYTLASIVESETQAQDERPTIAGVYLNRLELNMPLQADPTIRFALKDAGIRRILHKHLEIDSPYNTYRHTGLPPGPIAMPTIHSINAVLNPEEHDYIFFCAKPGNEGRHSFAKTLSAHMENARDYQAWLNENNIR